MAKTKKKKKNAGPPLPNLRLSQCMIVKNEEKNIEKALKWAKGIAFEQIVVDTGSTDRTVEIAKKMGAKVYHFEWINDFSAAKNYAIGLASGNWIAFLDADESFSKEDAKMLMTHLKRIHSDPLMREKYQMIMCPMVQLDDEGKAAGVDEHIRVFRNLPVLRYKGRIHERIYLHDENVVRVDNISIMHTGYSFIVQRNRQGGPEHRHAQGGAYGQAGQPEPEGESRGSFKGQGEGSPAGRKEHISRRGKSPL